MTQELSTVEKELPVAAMGTMQAITPMQMLQIAVSQGADIDKLSKLMDLQERWEKNEARKAFVSAMNAFKADAPRIVKTKEVSFGSGKTAYKHALAGVASEQIAAALAKHGISHRWDVEQTDGKIRVGCILTHDMGHSERVQMEGMPDTSGSKNSIQAVGSTVSYLQRYTLLAATGLVPQDADTDANVDGKHEMPENQRADFEAAIDALADLEGWKKLWADILSASTATGDIETHEHLRTLMAAKRKGLK